ncbi:MAG: hypothetical protein NC930_07185 [Candidatus Omnitrophica bacterium]|nr:hypothetical protein [Candidatus Omnitrophota bacterium]
MEEKSKKKSGPYRLSSVLIYIGLMGSFLTYFQPVLTIKMPALEIKSWSVHDIVKTVSRYSFQRKKPEKGQIDFFDVVRDLAQSGSKKNDLTKTSAGVLVGLTVPVALVLAYLFILLSFLFVPLRIRFPLVLSSGLAAFLSGYVIMGLKFLSAMAQEKFSTALDGTHARALSALTRYFAQEVSVQPEKGIFLIVSLTSAIFLVSLFRPKKS